MLTRIVVDRVPRLTTIAAHAVAERMKNPPAYAFHRSGAGGHRVNWSAVTTGSPFPQETAAWARDRGETETATATGPTPARISTPDFAK